MPKTPDSAPIPVHLDRATQIWLSTIASAQHGGDIAEAAAAVLAQSRRHAEQLIIESGIDISGGWDALYQRLDALSRDPRDLP
jgi:hypothetical protein